MANINSKIQNKDFHGLNNEVVPQKFDFMKDKVVVLELEDYKPEEINKSLKLIIELLGIKGFFSNKSILIKPNLLAPSKYAYTPPELALELIKILKTEMNAKEIMVGDSTMTKSLTHLTFNRSKFKDVCESEDIRIINFFESERIKVKLNNPEPAVEENIYLPKEINDIDILINLPKLKTHNGYIYTGAIKNLFGLLGNKMSMHMSHKNKTNFQHMLADIYFAVEETNASNKPKVLSIMDAVIAMEGKGPRAGQPRKVGLIIAGFNPAAVDIVGYTLMNGNPKDLDAIMSLAKRTDLPIDINQLRIEGIGIENFHKFIIRDFKKPNISILKKDRIRENNLYSKLAEKVMKISIKINRRRCLLCEECVRHCPAEALFKKNEKILVNHEKCIECFCCGESCPNNAISAKFYLFRVLPYFILLMSLGIIIIILFLSATLSGV